MNPLLTVLNDMIVIIFDLLFYMNILPQREHTRIPKIFKYIGCVLIVFAYFFLTYVLHYPAATSSAVSMGIPSFFLFLYYAKYRDSRFVLTFCFIDTISLMVGFVSKVVGLYVPCGDIISVVVSISLFLILYILSFRYTKSYQQLLEEVDTGWCVMAISMILIYFGLIFIAGYPYAMIERPEYIPVWAVFAIVVISCYVVFFHSILKTKKINQQNILLRQEKEIYNLAFLDALTGLYNRASYIEKINEFERTRNQYETITILAADVNEFKDVNDCHGHLEGDRVLIAAANALKKAFIDYEQTIFRMGGDEFLIILPDISEVRLQENIRIFHQLFRENLKELKCCVTMATGYYCLSTKDRKSLETAYALADKQMYKIKAKHKKETNREMHKK